MKVVSSYYHRYCTTVTVNIYAITSCDESYGEEKDRGVSAVTGGVVGPRCVWREHTGLGERTDCYGVLDDSVKPYSSYGLLMQMAIIMRP